MTYIYHPDFNQECRICGNLPCVVVEKHKEPNTELCGACFFGTAAMLDWELWNEAE